MERDASYLLAVIENEREDYEKLKAARKHFDSLKLRSVTNVVCLRAKNLQVQFGDTFIIATLQEVVGLVLSYMDDSTRWE